MQELYQNSFTIPFQYADDYSFIFVSANKHLMNYQMVITTPLLKQANFYCSKSKQNATKYSEKVSPAGNPASTLVASWTPQKTSTKGKYLL